VYLDFHSLMKSVLLKVKRTKRIPAWQLALACPTVLALLTGLLWLAPWQMRQDGPATITQSRPIQGSDRTAEGPVQPNPPPLTALTSAGDTVPEAPASQNPVLPTQQSQTSSVDPGQEHHAPALSQEPTEVLDTQAMQKLVTRLETSRSNPEEDLDTRAMDRLLARLESADKIASSASSRSKIARKRSTRVLPRAGDRGAPGAVSPPRTDAFPLSSASEMPFPDPPR
jgi:hypothetical protein